MRCLVSILFLASMTTFASAETIRFWTTEEQPDRLAKQKKLAADFKAKTGHTVEVIPVTEKDLGTRATAAFAANDLPDVILPNIAIRPSLGRSRCSRR